LALFNFNNQQLIFLLYRYLLIKNKKNIFALIKNNIYQVKFENIEIIFENEAKINLLISNNLKKNWTIERMNALIKATIFNGVFLIKFLKQNKKIVIDQSLNFIKKFFWNQEHKYINAILDNCTKNEFL